MDQEYCELQRPDSPAAAPLPYVRVSALQPFIDFCVDEAAPLDRWEQRVGFPVHQLRHPDQLLPLHSCYRLLDMVASETMRRDIGVAVAARSSPFALGSLGMALRTCTTILDYVSTGTRLIASHSNSGIRLWYAREGARLRISQRVVPGAGLGPAIADSYTLALTLNTLRDFLGDSWSPLEIRLRRDGGYADAFAALWPGAVIIQDSSHSSFTLPLSVLHRRITPPGSELRDHYRPDPTVPLPVSFTESVELLITMSLHEGKADIGSVAAAAGVSVRSLQRRLEAAHTSFRSLLSKARSLCARQLLTETTLPIAAIASELGYTDASNFARAFTRANLLSPTDFRAGRLPPAGVP